MVGRWHGHGQHGYARHARMPGMGAPEGNGESPVPAGAPMMKTSGRMTMQFNVKAGQFLSINGNMGVETSMGGTGKIKANTTFKMNAAR